MIIHDITRLIVLLTREENVRTSNTRPLLYKGFGDMVKRECLLGVILVCLLFTACGPGNSSKIKGEELPEGTVEVTESLEYTEFSEVPQASVNLAQSIIQVQTDTRLGSGILWEKKDNNWIVVTAAHVVEGLQEAEVYLVQEEKILTARVTEVNGLDLAFLTVPTSFLDEATEEKYQPITAMTNSREDKPRVFAVGYNPYGELCEYAGMVIDEWIYVEDFDNYMLLCDCGAEAGMSGGAVVTADGKLVGLVCGENEKGYLAALPVGVIKSEYQFINKN